MRTARRAETRQCPICEECIPLRLLAKHAELESERVDEILNNVGSSEVHYDDGWDCEYVALPSSSLFYDELN